jgi:hypothetical protein
MNVTYKIADGRIEATYESGTVADFGSASEPFKTVLGRALDGRLMVCTMSDAHWQQLDAAMLVGDK